jgi:hypothetical protein
MSQMNLSLSLRSQLLMGGIDAYAIGGLKPAFVADFAADYYRAVGGASVFSDALTFSRAGNATMVDSDGVLKWAPHNLQLNSETSIGWGTNNVLFTDNALSDPFGGNRAIKVEIDAAATPTNRALRTTFVGIAGVQHTQFIYIKAGTGVTHISINCASGDARFQLSNGAKTFESAGVSATSTPLADGWFLFSLTFTPSSTYTPFLVYVVDRDSTTAVGFSGGEFIYMCGVSLHRSDLGGMVNNPDRGDSYVPTTSSAVYLPRRGHHVYNGTAWVNEGLLLESEARTNLFVESNDLSTQSGIRATLSVDQATSPSGETDAGSVIETAVSGDHRVDFDSITVVSGTTYTLSFFLKANGRPWCRVQMGTGGFGTAYANFDLSDGSVGTTTGITGTTVQDYGDGWYRCSVTANATASAGTTLSIQLATADNAISYTGDGSSGAYVYGAQLEAGSTPSSYIPNAGATSGAIRAPETLTAASANLPWPTDPLAVSIQMQGRVTYADTDTPGNTLGTSGEAGFWRWFIDASNYINVILGTGSTATGGVSFIQEASGVADFVDGSPTAYSPGILVPFNIASRHGSTFINGSVDGTALTADTTPTALPDLSSTDLQIGYDFNGTIKTFRVWASDLGDTGIEGASS